MSNNAASTGNTASSDAVESNTSALICNLSAIDAAERADHLNRARYLLSTAALERRELPNGYAFQFKAEEYALVVKLIDNERRCCPFWTFTLFIPAGNEPLWLHITGEPGAKEVLRSELNF